MMQKTNCPYTTMMNFFHGIKDVLNPVVDPNILAARFVNGRERDIDDALNAYKKMNHLINEASVSGNSRGGRRGNAKINIYPGAPNVNVNVLAASQLHTELRWTVGELGRNLNKNIFSPKAKELSANVTKNVSAHRGQVKILRHMHAEAYGKKATDKTAAYSGFDDLKTKLSWKKKDGSLSEAQAKLYDETLLKVKEIDCANRKALNTLREEFANANEYHLNGDLSAVKNVPGGSVDIPLNWFYLAEWAGVAVLDTTKIPVSLSDAIQMTLGDTEAIIPAFVSYLVDCPKAYTATTADILEEGLDKMREALVVCGTFDALTENKKSSTAKMCKALGLHTQKDYDAVKPDTGELRRDAVRMTGVCPVMKNDAPAPRSGGGCPMGFKAPL